MISIFDLLTILLVTTALFAWLNHRFVRLPHTIGLLVMGLAASLLLVIAELLLPDAHLYDDLTALLRHLDFQRVVLEGMLAFLLFAGALHVDTSQLRSRAWSVGAMATLGVVISTLVIAAGLWLLARPFGIDLPFAWALVFGAVVSPTDPVAVLAILKSVTVPKSLEVDMAGESLFNDGVAVVVFAVLLMAATSSESFGAVRVAELLAMEAGGGALLGLACGYTAYLAMRRIDDYPIEVLISIALVMGTYALASHLHMSGPIGVVVAGLFIGNKGPKDALSDRTQRYLFGYWTLVDEILNSILFLLIGLEVLVLDFELQVSLLALAMLPVIVLARLLATGTPVLLLRRWQSFVPGTIAILTWGGLRGGISIALALSLPQTPERPLILTATYVTVVFTIVVQGLTLKRVIRRFEPWPEKDAPP